MKKLLIENELKYKSLFDFNPDYTCFLDPNGKIIDLNLAVLNTFNYALEDIKGLNLLEMEVFHPEDTSREAIRKLIKEKRNEPLGIDEPLLTRFIDRNGKPLWCKTYVVPIIIHGKLIGYQGIAHDITQLKKAQNKIKKSLDEKEVLLREIHHRVKNNMQIMSSLLNMETHYIDDEKTLNLLKEGQNRIRSMSMVHEKLYQSHDLASINIQDYIINLVNDIFYSYNVQKTQIALVTDIEDITLNLETSMPCGLILCELVSNSLKYGFPHGKQGEVKISLKLKEEIIQLIISDNGIGLDNEDFLNSETLGIQLVQALIQQLDGNLELDLTQGTQFKISFKEAQYKKRT